MTALDIRAEHMARLNSYRESREYADWCERMGMPRPPGELPSLIGSRWEIDEATFDDFQDMLPPIYTPRGFFMSEESFDGFHAKFTWEGGKYFCEFARLPRRSNAPEPGPQP